MERVLSDREIKQMREYVGYQYLQIDHQQMTLTKHHPKMYVDLSAIAKGYGVDVVAAYFNSIQAKAFMVEIGGELKVKGLKNGHPWQIGIVKPNERGEGIEAVIPLTNMAMATSGDYRNFFTRNGKRYSHTIDPRSLKPIEHNLASVTVLDKSCARADALATTLMVMGVEKGAEWANKHKIAALFLYRSAEQLKARKTDYFPMVGK
jgi:thiamine biosynthesis lipoprotein